MPATGEVFVLGAVAYDPKVVTIWEGFRRWFERRGFSLDYVLYSNYERQVEALLAGELDVAWNSPLAWARTRLLARNHGKPVRELAMRDTDCDLTSVVVVRGDSGIESVAHLAGKTVAVGAVDSPQATLIPLSHLKALGLEPDRDFKVQYHQVMVGKHGDHIGGEREAARALMTGDADAACMIDTNHLLFSNEGTLPPEATRILTQTPPFDHCNFTVATTERTALADRFQSLLFEMKYDDPEVRALFDLEGLKAWRPARTEGYSALEAAIVELGFYDQEGHVTAADYRP